jgi:hypothetical protein
MTNEIQPAESMPPKIRHPVPPAPIHPLAALTTIVLDNIFGWIEIVDPFAILVTSLIVGGIGFLTTLFVQRHLAKDEWGESVAKGLVMGVLAGVPYQVTGTAVGAILLGWAGANKWIKIPERAPSDGSSESEIVEVDPKE